MIWIIAIVILAGLFWFVFIKPNDPRLSKKGCHFDEPGNSSPWDKERK